MAKQVAEAKEADKRLQAEAQRELDAKAKEIKAMETKLAETAELKPIQDTGKKLEQTIALRQATERDVEIKRRKDEEAARAEEKARKEREAREKIEKPFAVDSQNVLRGVGEHSGGVFTVEKRLHELAAKAQKDPLNVNNLSGVLAALEALEKSTSALSPEKNQLKELEARMVKLITQIQTNLQQQLKGATRH